MFVLDLKAGENHFPGRLIGKDILGLEESKGKVMNRRTVSNIF